MNLFGPHIHRAGYGLDLLGRWKPEGALVMDVDSNYIREARARSPNTVLVVRVYEDGANFLEWSPVDWVNRLLARFPNERPNLLVTINEPFGHDSQELFERFDIWESEVIRLLQAQGTDGLACNFGTGNFTAGADRVRIPDVFPRICEVANAMGPHDYSWDELQDGWGWYAGRWFAWYDDIKAATGKKMKFLVGECGLTQAIIAGRPDHGWQSGGPENVTAESYLATLRWYLEQIVNWDAGRGIVLGLCLFNFYDQFHASFEHINRPEVVDAIIAMDAPVPDPEPNGGETMDIKVIDKNYEEQDFEWAKNKYGVAFRRAEVEPGQKVWRLVELWEKTGPHSLVTQVLDEDWKPVANAKVTFYWSDAPSPPEPPTTVYDHDWYRNYIWGPTNANGDVGPGMGSGAWINVDPEPPHDAIGGGPHAVWIHDANIPSDICEKLGMRGGTPHDHLDQKFKLEIAGEEDGNGDGDDAVLEFEERLVFDHHVAALCIAYPTSAAMNTRGDGQGPGVDEDLHPAEWVHPDGMRMALIELTADFEGTEPRTYTLRVYRLSDGASLTSTESEVFPPLGAPRKRIIYVYVKSEEDPEPDPDPNGDLLAELLAELKKIGLDVAEIHHILEGEEPEPIDPEEVFRAAYFDNMELAGEPVLTRDEATIDHFWGVGSPGPPIPADYFSARWRGSISFAAGTYEFHALVDDGFRLLVDGVEILSAWYPQSPTQHDVTLTLSSGKHEIVVEYYEQTGGATCRVWWNAL